MSAQNPQDEGMGLAGHVLEILRRDARGRLGLTEEGRSAVQDALYGAHGRGALGPALLSLVELGHVLGAKEEGWVAEAQLLEIADGFALRLKDSLDARDDQRRDALAARARALTGQRWVEPRSPPSEALGEPDPELTEYLKMLAGRRRI